MRIALDTIINFHYKKLSSEISKIYYILYVHCLPGNYLFEVDLAMDCKRRFLRPNKINLYQLIEIKKT